MALFWVISHGMTHIAAKPKAPLCFLLGESCMAKTKNQLQNLTSGHGTPRSNVAIAISCCMPIDAFWHSKHSDSLRTSICNPSKMIFLVSYCHRTQQLNTSLKSWANFVSDADFLLKKEKFYLFDPVMTLSDLTLRSNVKINSTIVFYAWNYLENMCHMIRWYDHMIWYDDTIRVIW